MFVQVSRLGAADKKARKEWLSQGTVILAATEVFLWGLLLYALS